MTATPTYPITIPPNLNDPVAMRGMYQAIIQKIHDLGGSTGMVTQVFDTGGFVIVDGTGTVITIGGIDTTALNLTAPSIALSLAANAYFSASSTALAVGYSAVPMTLNGTVLKLGNDQAIQDSAGHNYIAWIKNTGAVNYFSIENNVTGSPPILLAQGSDTNIDLAVQPKGTGHFVVKSTATASGSIRLYQESSTSQFIAFAAPTSGITAYTLLFPPTVGTSNQYLTNSGTAGTLQWTTLPAPTQMQDTAGNVVIDGTAGGGLTLALGATDTTAITATIATNSYLNLSGGTLALGYAASTMTINGTSIQLLGDQPILDSSGNAYLSFTKTASAVNQLNVTNASTGTHPILSCAGSDSNIGITIAMKGTASLGLTSNAISLNSNQPLQDSSGNSLLAFTKATTAVNNITLANAATGNNPALSATGSDSNVGINLQMKGAASVNVLSTATSSGTLSLFQESTTNSVGITVPTTTVTSHTLALPAAAPTVNQVLTAGASTATNLVWATPAASGNWILISSATASASATISFTGLTTNKMYVVVMQNIVAATNTVGLWARFSTNGGSSYDTTSIYFTQGFIQNNSTTLSGLNSGANSKIFVSDALNGNLGTGANAAMSGLFWIWAPDVAQYTKGLSQCSTWTTTATMDTSTQYYVYQTATAVNAVQFLMSSGNIASGIFSLYGIS